jgi:hypothetical protein
VLLHEGLVLWRGVEQVAGLALHHIQEQWVPLLVWPTAD